ncbi:MAG: tetrahydrofolate dehydrogenase/cyclohydrolase catalytic domain-containing protein [Patescibacteria group bacterium]|jgi:methylenetetrahydrofolate dehydrogenase (NADP+)/methenyltetrahydrofolate cyclohydrolase
MKIDCSVIAHELEQKVREKLKGVYKKSHPPTVALFYVGSDPLTEIFIERKKKLAARLGIKIEVFSYPKTPMFQDFASHLRRVASSKDYHAVIIQRPLPPELTSQTLDNFIPLAKEVEGQKYKSPYISPVGMTTLSILKYVYTDGKKWEIKRGDAEYFKRNFKKRFVVLAGRGETTGQPIANTLVHYKMALVITHSQTPTPEMFYKQADIVIATTGQPILNKLTMKPGCLVINYGYRREDNVTKGDYDETELETQGVNYTPIVNGTGPVMLLYLMRNVVEAYTRQVK